MFCKISRKKYQYMSTLVAIISSFLMMVGCSEMKGNVTIIENLDNDSSVITYSNWSVENKCEMYLVKGDQLMVDAQHDEGILALSIYGKDGVKAYDGKIEETTSFFVTITESDTYIIHFRGKDATGVLSIQEIE